MMTKKRRGFHRPLGNKRYRKQFVISVEGTKTEVQYFCLFSHQAAVIHIECLSSKKTSPSHVLKKMKNHLSERGLSKSDEAWVVVDRDHWQKAELESLLSWSRKQENYGFALSTPNFEYWLLLHFENGDNIKNPTDCINHLRRHLPNYNKDINSKIFTMEKIHTAIQRVKKRDSASTSPWEETFGSTVYKLIENIIDALEPE